MEKTYKKRKGENLAQWIDRLAPACCGRALTDVHDILTMLSKESYIEGFHDGEEIKDKLKQ